MAALALICLAMGTVPGLAANLVSDAENKCATSNPYPQGQESIRWTGGCRNGLLDGQGVLTWYRDGRWTERNEGSFRAGELNGNAVTTFPDGSTIAGTYIDGKRHGEFILARVNDTYSRSIYRNDQLVEEKPLSREQMRSLLAQRQTQARQPQAAQARATTAPPPSPAPVAAAVAAPAVAATAQPAAAYAAPAPAAPTRTAVAAAAFPPPAPAVSSMTHARAVAPPWSPIANAAVVAATPVSAPAPRVAQPPAPATVAQPSYVPPQAAPAVAVPGPVSDMPLPSAVRVCTTPGLYPKGAGWCGVIRREQGDSIEVEVTNVRLNSLFAIGIAAGECTGGEFVGSGDRGKRIWVPARCMQQ